MKNNWQALCKGHLCLAHVSSPESIKAPTPPISALLIRRLTSLGFLWASLAIRRRKISFSLGVRSFQ